MNRQAASSNQLVRILWRNGMGRTVFIKRHVRDPERIKPLVSDYRMNLIQIRTSDSLHFCNPDVNTVFDVSRPYTTMG